MSCRTALRYLSFLYVYASYRWVDEQVAQLSQRDRAAAWVSFGQNISERRYSAPNVVGARELEALIVLHGTAIQIPASLRCKRIVGVEITK